MDNFVDGESTVQSDTAVTTWWVILGKGGRSRSYLTHPDALPAHPVGPTQPPSPFCALPPLLPSQSQPHPPYTEKTFSSQPGGTLWFAVFIRRTPQLHSHLQLHRISSHLLPTHSSLSLSLSHLSSFSLSSIEGTRRAMASAAEAVEELTRLYRELPPRPAVEEVEAAEAVLASADAEEARASMRWRGRRPRPQRPRRRRRRAGRRELLAVLREARRNAVRLRALQQRKEAAYVVELERRFKVFDDLIQRASRVVSSSSDAAEAGGGTTGDGYVGVGADSVDLEMELRKKEAAVAAAAAVAEMERGSKGLAALGLESKPISSLRRDVSAGNLLSSTVLFCRNHEILKIFVLLYIHV